METRKQNKEFERIAQKLIQEEEELEYIKNSPVRIAYLESDIEKKSDKDKLVLGQCEKVLAKNQWAINYDFTITLFLPNIENLSLEQKRILLFHELLHVGIEQNEDGDFVYSTRKHDLEDFKIIIDRFGTDWAGVQNE